LPGCTFRSLQTFGRQAQRVASASDRGLTKHGLAFLAEARSMPFF
jgi:hypothetical protein